MKTAVMPCGLTAALVELSAEDIVGGDYEFCRSVFFDRFWSCLVEMLFVATMHLAESGCFEDQVEQRTVCVRFDLE